MNKLRLLLCWIALASLAAGLFQPLSGVQAAPFQQDDDPAAKADQLLASMSPEDKVSQLFLVTFDGSAIETNSRIYSLVRDHHIGGIVMRADNNNFIGPSNSASAASQLIRQLQTIAWEGSQTEPGDAGATDTPHPYIPLLVGISQEGDLLPYDQIIAGLTPLPNQMAIGATWNPQLAEQVGEVMGMELSALGFNLFFGPSLDVLDVIHTEGSVDLGTRTFGGDPFWVSEMGQAYIRGIHRGSNDSMAVIAKHFPGRGGSDRPVEEEVATVRKSLEQLKQIELAPFFGVTGGAPDAPSMVDGLMLSHIRYQGFQGNIRATTRPISLDQAAVAQVMALEPLQSWYQQGGVIVSDDLGSAAIRRSFDPTSQSFDARQVASQAFLSGNDLLYVDDFVATNDQDSYTTIVRTLEMFTQKYREDPAFAQRVDQSARRVLTLKYKLYPNFRLDQVRPREGDLAVVGRSTGVSFDVARQAVTLISPAAQEISVILPRPPALTDRIIFLTDAYTGRQCEDCSPRPVMGTDALRDAVLRLYGPEAAGLVYSRTLSSYSFVELNRFLDGEEDMQLLENDLRQADWVVVSLLNTAPERESSTSFKRLLSVRPELLSNKRVVAFAFNAPYYLDATDISKLTAYYGLYSKTAAFVEVAARILFQELRPTGSLPVSVPGIGYDLITATSPDPEQVIPLYIDQPDAQVGTGEGTATPALPAAYKIGDQLPLRTGVILDHNGHPVPDGTPVRFLFSSGTEAAATQQIESYTIDGIASASFRIANSGILEVRVVSEPALSSTLLRLDVEGQMIATILPTPAPTETPQPTPTLTPTPEPTPSTTPAPPPPPDLGGWALAMVLTAAAGIGAYWTGWQNTSIRWAVRWGLLAGGGGLLAYSLIMALWDGESWLAEAGLPAVLGLSLAGAVTGWLIGLAWWRIKTPHLGRNLSRTNEPR